MTNELRTIVHESNVSARPEYYSGRGAIIADLDSKILEKLHAGISKEFGINAARNFTLMVADLEVLSATDFLISLDSLEYNKWEWATQLRSKAKGIDISSDEQHRFVSAMCTLGAALGRGDRDDTGVIRYDFLRNHRGELPESHLHVADKPSFTSWGFGGPMICNG